MRIFKRIRILGYRHARNGGQRRRPRRAAAPVFAEIIDSGSGSDTLEAATNDIKSPLSNQNGERQLPGSQPTELPGSFPETPAAGSKEAEDLEERFMQRNGLNEPDFGDDNRLESNLGITSQCSSPGKCQSCKTAEITEWRWGPNGSGTLYNDCGYSTQSSDANKR